jgi:ribonuclease P protein component
MQRTAQNPVPKPVPDPAQMSAQSAVQVIARSSVGKRFPRESRLLRHADFDRVYREGKRHFSTHMTVFYLPRTEPPVTGLRIGLTVSRALGGAVDRNRLRRRMREAVRFTRPVSAPAIDVVFNPKRSVLKAEFEIVLTEVGRAFETVLRKSSSTGGEK